MFSIWPKSEESRSFRLFIEPTFIEGVGRILDFDGALNIYNKNSSEEEADLFAMQSDWRAVGDDLRVSIVHHKQEEERAQKTLWEANTKKVTHAQ